MKYLELNWIDLKFKKDLAIREVDEGNQQSTKAHSDIHEEKHSTQLN